MRELKIEVTKRIFAALLLPFVYVAVLNAQPLSISVKDAQFMQNAMERLVAEYHKVDSSFSAVVVKNGAGDAAIGLSRYDVANGNMIARFIALPIANSKNEILGNKKVVNGLSDKLQRQIFVEQTVVDALDAQEAGVKQLPGTVYSIGGGRSVLSQAVADKLQVEPKALRGKKIIGREENLLNVVRNNADALAFNVANLIYDNNNGGVAEGITILAIDLDGNGKISEEERVALRRIDSLVGYLESQPRLGLPNGDVIISINNEKMNGFVDWIMTDGQKFVNNYGLLKINGNLTAKK